MYVTIQKTNYYMYSKIKWNDMSGRCGIPFDTSKSELEIMFVTDLQQVGQIHLCERHKLSVVFDELQVLLKILASAKNIFIENYFVRNKITISLGSSLMKEESSELGKP